MTLISWLLGEPSEQFQKGYELGFFAGLKAVRLQTHSLEKVAKKRWKKQSEGG